MASSTTTSQTCSCSQERIASVATSPVQVRTVNVATAYSGVPNLILNCLLALVFAAACVCLLGELGIFAPSDEMCAVEGSYGQYSECEVFQDLRKFRGFAIGALLTCVYYQHCCNDQEDGQRRDEGAARLSLFML